MNSAMESILNSSFIERAFIVIMSFVVGIVQVILYPVGLLVKNTMPELDNALSQVNVYLDYILQYIGWATSALAIPSVVIVMIVGYYIFTLTTGLATWGFKVALKWKKTIA